MDMTTRPVETPCQCSKPPDDSPHPAPLVDTIPIEILQSIFLLDIEQGFELYSQALILHMLHLTHVCRRWRLAALGFPQMWFPVSFTREFLQFHNRNTTLPQWLKNAYEFGFKDTDPSPLKENSHRLQKLNFDDTPGMCNALFKELGSNFLGLKILIMSLDVNCYEDQEFNYPNDWWIEVEAPNVTHLSLEFVRITSLNSFNNLIHLYLSSIETESSIDDLVSLLCRCPRLRYYTQSELDGFSRSFSMEKKPALPELELVFLCCLGEDLIPFSRLIFPSVGPKTKLRILEDWPVDCGTFWEVASETLWILQGSHELSCTLFGGTQETVLTVLFSPNIPDSPASATIEFRWCTEIGDVIRCPFLNLSQVTSVIFCFDTTRDLNLLPRFENVKRLGVMDQGEDCEDVESQLSNPLACIDLEILRVALPQVSDKSVPMWMDALDKRVQSGHMPLKFVTFCVPNPEAYDNSTRVAHAGWSDSLAYKLYVETEWEDWATGEDADYRSEYGSSDESAATKRQGQDTVASGQIVN